MNALPPGSCDCHAHVIGDVARYPLWSGRSYDPPTASVDDYLALLERLGFTHGVLVQPSVYGFDNRCMLDALDQANGRLFGIAVPAPDATAATFDRMHERGVRGVRCNVLNPCGLSLENAVGWQPRLRELGWHVELHVGVQHIEDLHGLLRRFEVPVVIDHLGRPAPGRADPHDSGLRALIDAVRAGTCLVKLSAPYRVSPEPPPWSDATSLAHALIRANVAGCLWGSDWPHTDTRSRPTADALQRTITDWCPAENDRRTVLADNPARLLAG